jgi:hypothetical protein
MAKTAKTNPEDLVNAIRKTAKELGCNESEDRFQGRFSQSAQKNQ